MLALLCLMWVTVIPAWASSTQQKLHATSPLAGTQAGTPALRPISREEVPGRGIFTEEVEMPPEAGGLWWSTSRIFFPHLRPLTISQCPALRHLRTDLSCVDLAGEGSNTLLYMIRSMLG